MACIWDRCSVRSCSVSARAPARQESIIARCSVRRVARSSGSRPAGQSSCAHSGGPTTFAGPVSSGAGLSSSATHAAPPDIAIATVIRLVTAIRLIDLITPPHHCCRAVDPNRAAVVCRPHERPHEGSVSTATARPPAVAARGGDEPAGRIAPAGSSPTPSTVERVLDLLAGLLEGGLALVGLALSLQLAVVGEVAGGLLGLALPLLGHVACLVVGTHLRASLVGRFHAKSGSPTPPAGQHPARRDRARQRRRAPPAGPAQVSAGSALSVRPWTSGRPLGGLPRVRLELGGLGSLCLELVLVSSGRSGVDPRPRQADRARYASTSHTPTAPATTRASPVRVGTRWWGLIVTAGSASSSRSHSSAQ